VVKSLLVSDHHMQRELVLGYQTQPKPLHRGSDNDCMADDMMRVFVLAYK